MNFDCENIIEATCCTIIVSYNSMKWIEKCLNSIFKSTQTVSVIMIDNNSSDGTTDFVKKNFPQAQVLENGKNRGFGNANNLALKYALNKGYEYFFLLNHDTTIEPNTIEALISLSSISEEYGVLSPLHFNGDGTKIDSKFRTYVEGGKAKELVDKFQRGDLGKEVFSVPFVNAAAWMIVRKNLLQIGLFHPLFFHYGEDNNYCQRIIHSGLKVGVTGATTICHDRGESKSPISVNPRLVFERAVLGDVLNPFRYRIKLIRIFPAMYHALFLSKSLSPKNRIKYLRWAWNTFNSIFKKAVEYDQSELFNFEYK